MRTLNFGESASAGTGITMRTLFATDRGLYCDRTCSSVSLSSFWRGKESYLNEILYTRVSMGINDSLYPKERLDVRSEAIREQLQRVSKMNSSKKLLGGTSKSPSGGTKLIMPSDWNRDKETH